MPDARAGARPGENAGSGRGELADAGTLPSLQVDVIGSLAVRSGEDNVSGLALGGRRARIALAALALAPGPLPGDRLAALIWAGQPPGTWPAALRGVIMALRTALAPIGAGDQRLVLTTPSGYALAPGVTVDLHLATAALRAADDLAAQGRHEAVLATAEPVAQISGDQLLAGEDGSWLDAHRAEADAAALRALELVAASAGALGDHHRAVEAGRRAVAASPLDERSHRVLIRALHASGDRAAVVRAYEACRAVLAEQLGVAPAPETAQVYLAAIGDSAAADAARMPQRASAFFGRHAEAASLASAIGEPGLVTVTGRGGVGKSRLVLQVAASARSAAALSGGRLWVSLGSLAQDELVASTTAMTLGLPVGADDPATLLAGYLAPLGRALLVLDGCEAVVDGTASLVAALLTSCPTLSVVVTSRMPLSVETERVVPVQPLPPPVSETWHDLAPSPQVRLLADRARSGGGELTLDEATAPFVTELCRRCGGLPLAIELAGAQLAAMSPSDLLDHLPELIADGEDQVRAIAESSYALLDDDEATVFRRLAVLDGPFALPFLRDVVAGDGISPVRIVRILRELTARGLLAVDRSGPRWRYHQDDDLHRLARELLERAGEGRRVTERLADAVSGVIPADPRAQPGPYLSAIGEILPAVRSLLGAAVDGDLGADRGLELCFRLHRYWAASNVAEGRFWLSRLLAASPPTPWTAYAMYALGYLSYWSGDTASAARDLRAAVELMGDQPDEYAARALIYLGGLADDMDRGDDALGFVRRSIEAAAPFGADLQVAAVIGMGCVLAERADAQAAGYAAEAIDLCRRDGSPEQLSATLPTAAMVCWQVGDLATARLYVAEAMPLLAGSRRIARVVLLSAAAGIALADGDADTAVELGAQADADASDLGIDREIPLIRCILARAHLERGEVHAAAMLTLGAIAAARSLTFEFPLALCLETAAMVSAAMPGRGDPEADVSEVDATAAAAGATGATAADAIARMLAAAQVIRARGSRPGPVTLASAIDRVTAPGAAVRHGLAPWQADGMPAPVTQVAVGLAVDVLSRPGPADPRESRP
jgi:predicted ATPase/DNA-binding SARP family transcriptional activator